jgi:hypothetical protein
MEAGLCSECRVPIPNGYKGRCEKCRDILATTVTSRRNESQTAGLCPRCPTVKRNPLRFGRERCLKCVFTAGDCRTCGQLLTKTNPWCWDHRWLKEHNSLEKLHALVDELRRTAAEPVPDHAKKSRNRAGIKTRDLPPHWQTLESAVIHAVPPTTCAVSFRP